MKVELGNKVFEIKQGVTESKKFNLKKGENKLTVTGNGTIEFIWYKEVI